MPYAPSKIFSSNQFRIKFYLLAFSKTVSLTEFFEQNRGKIIPYFQRNFHTVVHRPLD